MCQMIAKRIRLFAYNVARMREARPKVVRPLIFGRRDCQRVSVRGSGVGRRTEPLYPVCSRQVGGKKIRVNVKGGIDSVSLSPDIAELPTCV